MGPSGVAVGAGGDQQGDQSLQPDLYMWCVLSNCLQRGGGSAVVD